MELSSVILFSRKSLHRRKYFSWLPPVTHRSSRNGGACDASRRLNKICPKRTISGSYWTKRARLTIKVIRMTVMFSCSFCMPLPLICCRVWSPRVVRRFRQMTALSWKIRRRLWEVLPVLLWQHTSAKLIECLSRGVFFSSLPSLVTLPCTVAL